MRTLHIIMPMAGRGSRFLEQGYVTPKPLIRVEGQPLFLRAIQGLRAVDAPRKYTFIVRSEHIRDFAIDRRLKACFPEAAVIGVEHTTRGAVETCLLAEARIAPDDAVAVQDCDLEFHSASFDEGIAADLRGDGRDVSGRVVSFRADHPRYSYAEINERGMVIRTAEKQVISDHALAGAYYFARGEYFLVAAHELVRRFEAGDVRAKELYLSLLYNILLESGGRVRLHELELYRSFGTPEELSGMDWSWKLADV